MTHSNTLTTFITHKTCCKLLMQPFSDTKKSLSEFKYTSDLTGKLAVVCSKVNHQLVV